MGGEIDGDAPLDYAAFQIFPTQNRYEAFVFGNKIAEKLAVGPLDKLALHLSDVEDLKSEGSDANFRLELPQTLSGIAWFTKSIVNRFLNIVGSPDLLSIINNVEDEVSQLEKASQFHLSLYAKGDQHHRGNREADGCRSNVMTATIKPEVNSVSSQASKSELLRAMDLRVTALREELVAALERAAGGTCSAKNINDLEKFCDHFGAINLKQSLGKVLRLGYDQNCIDSPADNKPSLTSYSRDNQYKTGGSPHSYNSVHSTVPVIYGVSPSKVAQVERQSSTDSEKSSDPSDTEPTSVERSRTLVRSASPRRSSSPMRRVQIGRSGSRRASALTIKSLGYFPARDKAFSQRDAAANSSGEEENSEQAHKKTESKVQRMMSVQDAISLFERKQEDIIPDVQQKKSSVDIPVNAKKSVLRRWSSGMGESSSSIQSQPEVVSEESAVLAPVNIGSTEVIRSSGKEKKQSNFISTGANPIERANIEIMEETHEKIAQQPMDTHVDTPVTQKEDTNRLETSVKWNQQKEAELNRMLMQMTMSNSSKPVKTRNLETKKNLNPSSEQRGGFYDHYKEKRDEKLRGENAGKRAEKEAKLKEMQQTINDRKAEMVSKTVTAAGKKLPLRKPLSSNKGPSQDANPKREISKPSITKRVSSKSAPLPAVRKSWPSTPLPRTTETPTIKVLSKISPSGTAPNRRKSQPAATVTRLSPKTEKPLPINKPLKGTPADTNKSLKVVNDKPQRLVTKSGKTTKAKVLTASVDQASTVSTNPTLYSKLTKKSSVVPLESKSFTRKSSEVGPTTMKTKPSSQSEESPQNFDNMSRTQQNEDVTNISVLIDQQHERNPVTLETQDVALESETSTNSHQICSDTHDQVTVDGDECVKKMVVDSPPVIPAEEEEETTISPHAWEEREEVSEPPISHRADRTSQLVALANVAPEALLSPRIRHSLSQMLQEEISEPDITEWGNAENPPSLIYQKDAPKGLKRLLKSGRSSANKYNAQSSLSRSQEGLASSLPTTSKGTKSFFSLSAFRGSKSNETKLR